MQWFSPYYVVFLGWAGGILTLSHLLKSQNEGILIVIKERNQIPFCSLLLICLVGDMQQHSPTIKKLKKRLDKVFKNPYIAI